MSDQRAHFEQKPTVMVLLLFAYRFAAFGNASVPSTWYISFEKGCAKDPFKIRLVNPWFCWPIFFILGHPQYCGHFLGETAYLSYLKSISDVKITGYNF